MNLLRILCIGLFLLPTGVSAKKKRRKDNHHRTTKKKSADTRISGEPWHMGGAHSMSTSSTTPYSPLIYADDPDTVVGDIMYHLSTTITLGEADVTTISQQIRHLYGDDLTPLAELLSLLNIPLNHGHAERFWQEHGALFLGTWPAATITAAYNEHLNDPSLVIEPALHDAIVAFNENVIHFLYAHPQGVQGSSNGVSTGVVVGTCAGVAAAAILATTAWWMVKNRSKGGKKRKNKKPPSPSTTTVATTRTTATTKNSEEDNTERRNETLRRVLERWQHPELRNAWNRLKANTIQPGKRRLADLITALINQSRGEELVQRAKSAQQVFRRGRLVGQAAQYDVQSLINKLRTAAEEYSNKQARIQQSWCRMQKELRRKTRIKELKDTATPPPPPSGGPLPVVYSSPPTTLLGDAAPPSHRTPPSSAPPASAPPASPPLPVSPPPAPTSAPHGGPAATVTPQPSRSAAPGSGRTKKKRQALKMSPIT